MIDIQQFRATHSLYAFREIRKNKCRFSLFRSLANFCCDLNNTLKAFGDFKNKQQKCNDFWYAEILKVYLTHYTLRQSRNVKEFPLDKLNATKNVLFFLSRAPTHHNFTFNSRFLYELKHKVRISKTECGIFDSVSFLLKFIFLFSKKHVLFDFKTS